MSLFLVFQAVVLATLLLICSVAAIRRFLPATSLRFQAALAASLTQPHRPAPLQRLGRWLAPATDRAGGCASGGCTSCSGCALKTRLATARRDRT
ncbi:DUF6587 family protein [Salinisphaera sp. T31B1]|uniref:DUF6587 family protein n=1 Tax=Salinisphaera sp. T31B1 TaxID=727963 RepID=UPI00333E571B